MSEQPYTPDTETVREQYTREQPPHIGTVSSKSAEFDRWLAGIKADVWERAVYHLEPFIGSQKRREAMADNPYRQEADQ